MQTSRRRIAVPIVTLLCAALGVLAFACGGKKQAAPTAVPLTNTPAATGTPAPTATPTPPPADSKLADRLRYEGDFEGAAAVYASVAAQASGAPQLDARLAQAQMLIRADRRAEARPVLDAYVATAGPPSDASDARFLQASTLDDLGDEMGALAAYERYIAAHGVLVDFARIERAKLLARLGRTTDATAAAQEVLASPGPALLPSFTASFTLSMGRAFEQGKDDASALLWYTRAKTASGDPGSASARRGGVLKRLGDPGWIDEYQSVIASYPSGGAAPELLDALDAAAVPVSPYVRGVVDYRAFRNDAARQALAAAIAAGDRAAAASYYLGALDERAGDKAAAIADYQRSYDLDPHSPVADDALWWRGRLLEAANRFADAGAVYAALASDHPASTWASDAAFRRGLMLYRGGDSAGAARIWSTPAAAPGGDGLRARFWQGRALKEAGDAAGDTTLQALVDDSGTAGSFYALRAEVLLGKSVTKEKTPKLSGYKTDWKKIESYLRDVQAPPTTGTAAPTPVPTLVPPEDPRWQIGSSLDAVGLHAQSAAVVQSIVADNALSVDGLYGVVRRLDGDGNTSLEARAAATLIAALSGNPKRVPDDLLRLAYPLAYGDLAKQSADGAKVSPLLLLSLVRQESFYDAEAGSGAGALGLTQVIPSTGQAIADELGVAKFAAADLFRPKLSLQFGARYLASQLTSFDGDAYHALAAYNGGPGTASDAIAIAGTDADLFVESLEFDETKSYVKLVMENYARYRQLYEGLDRPSLPK